MEKGTIKMKSVYREKHERRWSGRQKRGADFLAEREVLNTGERR